MDAVSPTSLAQFARALSYLPQGSSTNSKVYEFDTEPIVVKKGRGGHVWNLDGREFIDFKLGMGPVTLGYANAEVNEAIRRQLADGIVFGAPHAVEGIAAEEVTRIVPCAEQARFLKTGGEAIAATIKIARAYTGRDDVVQCGYNGWVNTLSGGPAFTQRIDRRKALDGIPEDFSKHHVGLPWNDIDVWARLFREHGTKIAAVVVASDYKDFDKGGPFLASLRKITRDNGTVMIMDEIVTGFRVALGGAHEYFGIDVDMAVFAKAIANGMPVSVYCGRRELMNLAPGLGISSTYGGEALSLAALRKVIEIYTRDGVIEKLTTIGETMWKAVAEDFRVLNFPVTLHGHPVMKYLQFPSGEVRSSFLRNCSSKGVSLYNPAYVCVAHTRHDIEEAVRVMLEAAQETKSELL